MPKSTSAGIRVIQSMNAGLNSSRSATGSWSCGTVAMKRLLKSTLSNSTRRREWLVEHVPRGALDRLDVEDRDDGRQVRHVRLDQQRAPGSTALRPKPPSSCSSASQEEPKKPSLSSPVSRFVPPGQSATGRVHRVDAADRLVAEAALRRQARRRSRPTPARPRSRSIDAGPGPRDPGPRAAPCSGGRRAWSAAPA